MHAAYWQLTHDPFAPRGRETAWFPAGDHDEALSRMLYVMERTHRCGMIWGDRGLGKSRLLRELRRQGASRSTSLVPVDLTGLNRAEFVNALANACGAGLKATASVATAWTFLEDWLIGRAAVSHRVVWLLDELDATAESLECDVLRLARLGERIRVTNTIIFAVQRPGLTEHLAGYADFAVGLTPWSPEESREFITQILVSAGGGEAMLTEDAWELLLEAGWGNPQRLMRITEVALIAGAALEADEITGELLSAVVHQLGWSPAGFHTMVTAD